MIWSNMPCLTSDFFQNPASTPLTSPKMICRDVQNQGLGINDHMTLKRCQFFVLPQMTFSWMSENPPPTPKCISFDISEIFEVGETWLSNWGLWVFLSEHVPEALQPGDTLLSYAPRLYVENIREELWNLMINVYIYITVGWCGIYIDIRYSTILKQYI